MSSFFSRYYFFIIAAIMAFIFFYDLACVDGLRQGTEGFYLLISKEMYLAKSFLTPLYGNAPHWSKPPLHFWFPFPFYSLGISPLVAARSSIVLISIGSLLYISCWGRRYLKLPFGMLFIILASSVGVLKYSRIYMMEIPFMMLISLSLFLYWEYLNSDRLKYRLATCCVLGLSILIKGPVSLVIFSGATLSYLIWEKNFKKLSYLLQIILTAAGIASLWFIFIYFQYGEEPLRYFFVRENVGKFTSRPYPARVLFQGLLLYALPSSILLIPLGLHLKKIPSLYQKHRSLIRFLLCSFFISFSLWFIPNQRSHHYAMPALPFFILILVTLYLQIYKNHRLFKMILFPVICFLTLPLLLLYLFPDQLYESDILKSVILASAAFGIGFFLFFKSKELSSIVFSFFLCLGTAWVLVAPLWYFPTIPQSIVNKIENKQIAVIYRKPYFIETRLGKKIAILSPHNIKDHVQAEKTNSSFVYLMLEESYNKYNLSSHLKIADTWPVWKRGNNTAQIVQALKRKDLTILQENFILLTPN